MTEVPEQSPKVAPGSPPRPKAAWYASSPGTWRDWITLLHLPYTAWHLSYVLIGAGLACRVSGERLAATLIAFALAVGVAAHAFDELRDRPLCTTISSRVLVIVAVMALGGAVAMGALGVSRVGWGLLGFMAVGVGAVLAYNLEWCHGKLHNDATFAATWGAFPLLTAYFAQTGTLRPAALLGAGFAYGLSRAQRTLSTEARQLRRRVVSVSGERVCADGSRQAISRASLLAPLEQALVALSWATCALGVGLVVARAGH